MAPSWERLFKAYDVIPAKAGIHEHGNRPNATAESLLLRPAVFMDPGLRRDDVAALSRLERKPERLGHRFVADLAA
jgi:hypothetical protein